MDLYEWVAADRHTRGVGGRGGRGEANEEKRSVPFRQYGSYDGDASAVGLPTMEPLVETSPFIRTLYRHSSTAHHVASIGQSNYNSEPIVSGSNSHEYRNLYENSQMSGLSMSSSAFTLSGEVTSSIELETRDVPPFGTALWRGAPTEIMLTTLLCAVILTAILGNLLVCVALYTDRRLRKRSNLFLASLAVADLFVSTVVMPLALARDMAGYWPFGAAFCEAWTAFDVMNCTASILNLCAISFDRFIHIKDPLRYGTWMTRRVVWTTILVCWLTSGLISFLPISLGWHKPDGETTAQKDTIDRQSNHVTYNEQTVFRTSRMLEVDVEISLESGDLPQCDLELTATYATVSSTVSFIAPCIVMIVLYGRLYFYARKHVMAIKSQQKATNYNPQPPASLPLHQAVSPVPSSGMVDGAGGRSKKSTSSSHLQVQTSGHCPQQHQQTQRHVTDHKAAITLGIIMGTFVLCWVPFFTANIVAGFCKTCVSPIIFKILTWLGWANSMLNPVIYSIFNSEFREAFRKILLNYAVRMRCLAGGGRRGSGGSGASYGTRGMGPGGSEGVRGGGRIEKRAQQYLANSCDAAVGQNETYKVESHVVKPLLAAQMASSSSAQVLRLARPPVERLKSSHEAIAESIATSPVHASTRAARHVIKAEVSASPPLQRSLTLPLDSAGVVVNIQPNPLAPPSSSEDVDVDADEQCDVVLVATASRPSNGNNNNGSSRTENGNGNGNGTSVVVDKVVVSLSTRCDPANGTITDI